MGFRHRRHRSGAGAGAGASAAPAPVPQAPPGPRHARTASTPVAVPPSSSPQRTVPRPSSPQRSPNRGRGHRRSASSSRSMSGSGMNAAIAPPVSSTGQAALPPRFEQLNPDLANSPAYQPFANRSSPTPRAQMMAAPAEAPPTLAASAPLAISSGAPKFAHPPPHAVQENDVFLPAPASSSSHIYEKPNALVYADHGEALMSLEELSRQLPAGQRTGGSSYPLQLSESGTSFGSSPPWAMSSTTSFASSPSKASLPLDRAGTLLSGTAHPRLRSQELSRVLGGKARASPAAGRASMASVPLSGAGAYCPDVQGHLEHDRGKMRVKLDVRLESDLVVEGGRLVGSLVLKIPKESDKRGLIRLSQPKIRVVGFEELLGQETRHLFYHQATVVTGDEDNFYLHGSPSMSPGPRAKQTGSALYASPMDDEGYFAAREGEHVIPFSLEVPVGKGAKGVYYGKNASIRYIAIASVKVKSGEKDPGSIAHFYRQVELYPYLNPAAVLASAPHPIQASASKSLFMGGPGKVYLSAYLHRPAWVAGQRVYIRVKVKNETDKKIKGVTLSLVRTVTLFRPQEDLDIAPYEGKYGYLDPDACSTSTSRKKLVEETMEAGQRGATGDLIARGWWPGAEAGESIEFTHWMPLPAQTLTIARSRHIEVLYSIKVSVQSAMASHVSVELPVTVVNFLSLDPPPSFDTRIISETHVDADRIARVRSAEAMGSPKKPPSRSPMFQDRGPPPSPIRQFRFPARPSPQAAPQVEVQGLGVSGPDLPPQAAQVVSAAPVPAPAPIAQNPSPRKGGHVGHQKSLDFIHSAIRSATARRIGTLQTDGPETQTSQGGGLDLMGLGISIDDDQLSSASEIDSRPSSPLRPSPPAARSIPQAILAQRQARLASQPHAAGPGARAAQMAPPAGQSLQPHGASLTGALDLARLGYVDPNDVLDMLADAHGDPEGDPNGKVASQAGDSSVRLNDESIDEVDFILEKARDRSPRLIEGDESADTTMTQTGWEKAPLPPLVEADDSRDMSINSFSSSTHSSDSTSTALPQMGRPAWTPSDPSRTPRSRSSDRSGSVPPSPSSKASDECATPLGLGLIGALTENTPLEGSPILTRAPSQTSTVSQTSSSASSSPYVQVGTVVPSVRNKVAALENREAAFRRFSHSMDDRTPTRPKSMASLGDLTVRGASGSPTRLARRSSARTSSLAQLFERDDSSRMLEPSTSHNIQLQGQQVSAHDTKVLAPPAVDVHRMNSTASAVSSASEYSVASAAESVESPVL